MPELKTTKPMFASAATAVMCGWAALVVTFALLNQASDGTSAWEVGNNDPASGWGAVLAAPFAAERTSARPQRDSVAPPKFTHVRISRFTGRGLFAGTGQPNARVVLLSKGQALADALVDGNGRWQVSTAVTGHQFSQEYGIEQRIGTGAAYVVGPSLRLYVPSHFHRTIEVAEDPHRGVLQLAAVRAEADDLSGSTSRRFDQYLQETVTQGVLDGRRVVAERSVLDPAWDWLQNANRSYHEEVVPRIRQRGGGDVAEGEPRPKRRTDGDGAGRVAVGDDQTTGDGGGASWSGRLTSGVSEWLAAARRGYASEVVPRLKGQAPELVVARPREETAAEETDAERRAREARQRELREKAIEQAERERREAERRRLAAEEQRRRAEEQAARLAEERRRAVELSEQQRQQAQEQRRQAELQAARLAEQKRKDEEEEAARLDAERQRVLERQAAEQRERAEAERRRAEAEAASREARRLEREAARTQQERQYQSAQQQRQQELAAAEASRRQADADARRQLALLEREREAAASQARQREQAEQERLRRLELERERTLARERAIAERARAQEAARRAAATALRRDNTTPEGTRALPPLPTARVAMIARPQAPAARTPTGGNRYVLRDTTIELAPEAARDQNRTERSRQAGTRFVVRDTSVEYVISSDDRADRAGDGRRQQVGSYRRRLLQARQRRLARKQSRRCHLRAGRRISPPGTYVVQRGDSLWKISRRHYRLGRYFRAIHRANPNRIKNANRIFPCQRFHLPSRGKL